MLGCQCNLSLRIEISTFWQLTIGVTSFAHPKVSQGLYTSADKAGGVICFAKQVGRQRLQRAPHMEPAWLETHELTVRLWASGRSRWSYVQSALQLQTFCCFRFVRAILIVCDPCDEGGRRILTEDWGKLLNTCDMMRGMVNMKRHELKVTWGAWVKWHDRGMRRLILTWLVHCFWARSSTTATIPTNLYWNSTNPLFHQVTNKEALSEVLSEVGHCPFKRGKGGGWEWGTFKKAPRLAKKCSTVPFDGGEGQKVFGQCLNRQGTFQKGTPQYVPVLEHDCLLLLSG